MKINKTRTSKRPSNDKSGKHSRKSDIYLSVDESSGSGARSLFRSTRRRNAQINIKFAAMTTPTSRTGTGKGGTRNTGEKKPRWGLLAGIFCWPLAAPSRAEKKKKKKYCSYQKGS